MLTSSIAAMFAVAAAPDRPVICVAHLVGEDPHVTSIGTGPAPPQLVLSVDDYHRLVADLRSIFVAEFQETIAVSIVSAGRHFARALERPETKPQILSGYIDLDGTHFARAGWSIASARKSSPSTGIWLRPPTPKRIGRRGEKSTSPSPVASTARTLAPV